MGLLVEGVWQDDVSRTKDGHFVRPATRFRNWVTPDGSLGPTGEDGFEACPSCCFFHHVVVVSKRHREAVDSNPKLLFERFFRAADFAVEPLV